jgi:hypothetical protein
MRRLGAAVLALTLLCGCGAVAQNSETPQQVVSDAAQKMSRLHAAKFDLAATVLEQLPASLTQSMGAQGAALSNLSLRLSGNGEASFPDKAAMTVSVSTGSVTIDTAVIVIGGQLYLKNPQTGTFSQVSTGNPLSAFTGEADPLSGAAILKSAQSIKDLGDTTLNGTAVHHYQIAPDKNKLAQQASTAQAQALMRSMLQNGSVQLEVWIGSSDHLLYRLKDRTDATVDLAQTIQASGQSLPSGTSLPAGSTVHVVANSTLNFHDFNASVTVTPPPVASP